jgi:hypothetical protein
MTVEAVKTLEAAVGYRKLEIYALPIPHGEEGRRPRGRTSNGSKSPTPVGFSGHRDSWQLLGPTPAGQNDSHQGDATARNVVKKPDLPFRTMGGSGHRPPARASPGGSVACTGTPEDREGLLSISTGRRPGSRRRRTLTKRGRASGP